MLRRILHMTHLMVREVLSTCADQSYLGILLNCCLCCSLASILHTPSNES
uniref:Uncharacterized protein n=1 Tax=Zea mays TaxID=4577 RepID=C0PNI1_MAIZE|nr:unknown [Zea mays]